MTNPVRQSFNRAAGSYAASAALQQLVRDQLLRQATRGLGTDFAGTLLDAGCGTGELLQQLHGDFPAATIIGIDFAEDMLRQQSSAPGPSRVNADLQQLPIADSRVDLYLSSLAWQWCDIARAVSEAARILHPGGHLWLTTLVSGTFAELAIALDQTGLQPSRHLLSMPEASQVLNHFELASMQVVHTQRDAVTTWHDDFASLRRSIRGVGANHLPTPGREAIDRSTRLALVNAYDQQRTAHGLPLTYNVLTIHAQRR
jgi:malonyl-CoA O-methyltransferase